MATPSTASFEPFFRAIKDYTSLTLLSDYDGTLAPFVVDRTAARPYPNVPEALLTLAENGVRVVIVSGREANEVQRLLGINSIEIWGCHGAE
ncbi:MAG TPA: trehalose-phosphatase, partial [Terriglobales bacterium]|nr:trehalose-phosphatase [Terriglobales bacterium]